MSIFIFGLLLLVGYLLQTYLTLFQLKDFKMKYINLQQIGRVVIGKQKGRVSAGTIILFAINDQNIILKGFKMQGYSFLARFDEFNIFNGEDISLLDQNNQKINGLDKLTRKAIYSARDGFILNINGEIVPPEKSLIEKIIIWFKKIFKKETLHGRSN